MVSATYLLPTLLLALAVSAKHIVVNDNLIRIPFAKKYNISTRGHITKSDRARVAFLRSKASGRASGKLTKDEIVDVDVTNAAVVYVADVDIGTPPTTCANTWVGAGKAFVKTKSSVQTSDKVSMSFSNTFFEGIEFNDTVSLGCGLSVFNQSIGVASSSSGFEGFDGALGLGPANLSLGTLSPDTKTIIPTVPDNLFSQGVINANQFAFSFEPSIVTDPEGDITNGELTFGGPADASKFVAPINFIPTTSVSPADKFWGFNQSIRYGTSLTILPETSGIVDVGSTLLLIATDAFKIYKNATGGVLDRNTSLLSVTPSQFAIQESLFFTINAITYEFTANAQAWPRALNTFIGGTPNKVYLIVADIGTKSGKGLDFVNGLVWLQRHYTLYDNTNRLIGFAETPSTFATTN